MVLMGQYVMEEVPFRDVSRRGLGEVPSNDWNGW